MINEQTMYQDTSTVPINTYAELKLRIGQLKTSKQLQEAALRKEIVELVDSLNLATIMKESLHKFATDKEVQFDAAKVGLQYGADFVMSQLIGKRTGLPVFLMVKLAQRAGGLLVKKYASYLLSGLLRRIVPQSKKNCLEQEINLLEAENTVD